MFERIEEVFSDEIMDSRDTPEYSDGRLVGNVPAEVVVRDSIEEYTVSRKRK